MFSAYYRLRAFSVPVEDEIVFVHDAVLVHHGYAGKPVDIVMHVFKIYFVRFLKN